MRRGLMTLDCRLGVHNGGGIIAFDLLYGFARCAPRGSILTFGLTSSSPPAAGG